MRPGRVSGSGHSILFKRENGLRRYGGNIHISREEAPLKTSERARIPRTVPAILAVLILIAAAAAGNAAAHTGLPEPMNPATSLILPEIKGCTVSRTGGRSFDSPGQARAPTGESALPGRSYTNTAPAHEEPQGVCDRNQAVQDSVLAELPGVSQCSGVTGEHLRGLSGTLDISGQGITALSAADFQGMSGITGMDASGNQLAQVPGDLLQQLRHQSHTHQATETSRDGYVIAVIDKSGSMSGQLSAAKAGARWLAANRPGSMPMAVVAFSDNAHTAQDFTTETGLLNNAINSLSHGGGTNVDNALAAAYSQAGSRPDTSLPVAIIVFSDGEFTLSGSLHETMSTNSAGGVKVSAISTSGQNVKMQDLATRGGGVYNTQTSPSQSGSYFPVGTTSETTTTTTSHEPSITSLDLSGNSLSSLPGETFAQLPTLTSINLSGNSLTSVPPGLPAGLTTLDLSDNSIGSLPDGVFNGLAQLDTLNMAGNPGAPFLFVIDLTQTGPTTMAVTLSQDAPFPVAAQLTALHTTVSPNSVSIARASKDGGIFTMTPDRDNAAEVTVGVTASRFTSAAHSGLLAVTRDRLEPEFPQVVSITVNSLNTAEGETVDIRVRADRAEDEDTTIRYAVRPDANPDTADASAADYTDLGNGQVTIPSGETGAGISITIISDQDHSEPRNETLVVSLLEPAPGQADDYWLATAVDITLTIRTDGICGRTPAVYEAVVDRLRNINTGPLPPVSQCSDVVPEHLPLVTGAIYLYNQNITTFRDHDFEGLSGVKELILDHNPITTLQDGLLDGLTDLRKIYMSHAQIGAVTKGTFALNTQLSELWLYSSRLTEIDDGAFSNLSNLRTLNLYNNNTGSFTAAKFQGLGSLHRLTLSNNLRAVPADLLSNTPELRTLGLQVNKLRDLPDDFFTGMRHLTEVNLLENTGNYVRTNNESNRFNFPVNLEHNQDGNVQARFPKGAPFPMTVNLSITNGSASPGALTIAAGSTTSNAAAVTPANQAVDTVVSVSGAAFTSGSARGLTPVPGQDITIPAAEEPPQQEPPSKPTNLTGVVNGDGSITLSWEAPGDDSVTGYQILRRRPTMNEGTLLVYVEDTGTDATTYTDTAVTSGVRHTYRVKAINSGGAGPRSNFVSITP